MERAAAACPRCGARAPPRAPGRRPFWIIAAVMALALGGGGALVVYVKRTAAARNAASLAAYPPRADAPAAAPAPRDGAAAEEPAARPAPGDGERPGAAR